MLGDTFVYGISLYVLTKDSRTRAKASLVKGVIILLLSVYLIAGVIYKIFNPAIPIAETISIMGGLALIANLTCFILLWKFRGNDLNMKSAWLCSRNDVITNVGVIIAGLLVGISNSMWPDIIIGVLISALVMQSSINIIKESYKETSKETK